MEVHGGNWAVIGLMVLAAFAMANTLLILNLIVAPSKPSAAKAAPYESGVPDVSPVKPRYTPRFYVVAMLFVVFDIEAIFIFPWAVNFDATWACSGWWKCSPSSDCSGIGYVYAWKKGALEWV